MKWYWILAVIVFVQWGVVIIILFSDWLSSFGFESDTRLFKSISQIVRWGIPFYFLTVPFQGLPWKEKI